MINVYIPIKNDLHFQLLFSYIFENFFKREYNILQKIRQDYITCKILNSLLKKNKKTICILLLLNKNDSCNCIDIVFNDDIKVLKRDATILELSIDQCRKKEKLETYLKLLNI